MEGLNKALVKTKFMPEMYTEQKDCCICMCEFDANSVISPLPCAKQHYFHAECLENWLKTKQECPLCREKVTTEKLNQMENQLKLRESQKAS